MKNERKPVKRVLVIADTHIGSDFGFSMAEFDSKPPKHDIEVYELHKARTENRKKFFQKVKKHLKNVGADYYTHIFILGDLVDNNLRDPDNIELRPTGSIGEEYIIDEAEAFILALPIDKEKTTLYFVDGSPGHVTGSDGSQLEKRLVRRLVKMGYKATIKINQRVNIKWSGYSYKFILRHILETRAFTQTARWFPEFQLKEIDEGRGRFNAILGGHTHQPRISTLEDDNVLVEIVAPLKFAADGEGYTVRYSPLFRERLGFTTFDFYEGEEDVERLPHRWELEATKVEDDES